MPAASYNSRNIIKLSPMGPSSPGPVGDGTSSEYKIRMRPRSSLTAAFIAAVLALLTASLLILSFRMQGTVVDLSNKTNQAIKIGDEINTIFSGEIGSILGFQATEDALYIESYQTERARINRRVRSLEAVTHSLGTTVQAHFKELQSSIDAWHQNVDSRELITRRLPSNEFRRVAFERLFVMRRAQASTNAFNEAVLHYESTQRTQVQRLAYLFMALAVIFGPLALLALVLMTHVLRRLNVTTSYLEKRAREEETLRQAGHMLTGGLTMKDVLRRVTEAAALLGQAQDVCIETVDLQLNETTVVAGRGGNVPATGTTRSYTGSLAQDVLQTGHPRIIQRADIEGQPASTFRSLVRRPENGSAMVIPLFTEKHLLGAMCLTRSAANRFTCAETPKIRILGDMASLALHRALTVERLQNMEDEDHFLAEASGTLASSLDYKETLKTVAQLAVSQMADWCIVHLIERQHVYHAELAGADPAKSSIAQQLRDKHRERPDLPFRVESTIRTRRASLAPTLSDEILKEHSVDDEHFELLRRLDLKSAMVVPMTVGHETVGALLLLAAGSRQYKDDDLRRAKKFGRNAALAIHNAQLYAVANDAIQSRDEVLRSVVHDLRNPLNTIQLSAHLLAAGSLPCERHQKMVQSITGASQRMNRLIDDLLTIGRMRAGQRLPLDLHRENPADIVEQVCELMGSQALEKSIALRSSRPWTPTPSIIVDRSRILQVFTNLLDNALKFTPPGGSITVSCEGSDGEIRFAVKDTGSGIDPADVDRIFDPFWQARETARMGAGLGLAIAKAVVEQHNGRIWVESKPGIGTTVIFTIPVAGAGEALPMKAA
jgi:signal transduction histidine kinase